MPNIWKLCKKRVLNSTLWFVHRKARMFLFVGVSARMEGRICQANQNKSLSSLSPFMPFCVSSIRLAVFISGPVFITSFISLWIYSPLPYKEHYVASFTLGGIHTHTRTHKCVIVFTHPKAVKKRGKKKIATQQHSHTESHTTQSFLVLMPNADGHHRRTTATPSPPPFVNTFIISFMSYFWHTAYYGNDHDGCP